MAQHPGAKPKEIRQGLKDEGIRVKMGLISNVKYGGAKKTGKRRGKRSQVMHAAARRTAGGLTVDQLLEVKRFASSIGGADQLRQALDMLDQLK
jgi:hypothetical protein